MTDSRRILPAVAAVLVAVPLAVVVVTVPHGSAAVASTAPAPPTGADDLGAGLVTVTSSDGVEVTTYGTATVHPEQEGVGSPAYFAVHAVQRVESATVVYLSVGFTEGDPDDFRPIKLSEIAGSQARFIGGAGLTSTRIVDSATGEVLSTLPDGQDRFAGPFTSPVEAFPEEPGLMHALYAVLPPLPDDVATVDVQVGFGTVIPDVPVGDGLLEPVVEQEAVPLGTGWPEVDPRALAAPEDPDPSRHPLSVVTEALDGSQVTTEVDEQVTIDIAADVLFAFDSADLSPEAAARVREVAAEVTARAAPGRLSVVGHTDSQGSDAYNDDLSRRRAEAVAAVLRPELAGGPALDLAVEGRGEREPVADNSTDEGRQANRRVSVTFTIDPTERETGR
jgi:outer membrane protein OmpA-like peptidoglycan-associated protein